MANNLKRSLVGAVPSPKTQMTLSGALGASPDVDMDNPDLHESSNKRAREAFDTQGLPPELVEILQNQMALLSTSVAVSIKTFKPQGSESKPWASEWKTERLYIALPVSGLSVEGNLIDQVILSGVRDSPTRVSFTAGAGIESAVTLSAQDERFLLGILSAFSAAEAPKSLKCGSDSIVDLTYYACWNLAAAHLVNDKHRRGAINPAVLPEAPVQGGRSRDYLGGRLKALKATLGNNNLQIAETIDRVIKLWADGAAERTSDSLRRIKVPWSLVLSKGAEFQSKEIKRKGQPKSVLRQLKTPINPKESAWLLPMEKKLVAHLCAPLWGEISNIQKAWKALDAEGSHASFDSFVTRLKVAYRIMHHLSDSAVKALGHRKAVILNCPAIRQLSKKDLKKMSANQLVQHFSKLELATLPVKAKVLFNPLYVFADHPAATILINHLQGRSVSDLSQATESSLSAGLTGDAKTLFAWVWKYITVFRPQDVFDVASAPSSAVAVSNMFDSLPLSGDD